MRLERAGLRLPFEDEMVEELANHIEDALNNSRVNEPGNQASLLCSKLAREDWSGLAREIRRARKEEDMNDRVRRVWLPGVAVTAVAYGLWTTLVALGMQPTVVWLRPASFAFFFVPWLLMLPVLGAAAAFWSKRNGGARRDVLAACSIAPLALAIFLAIALVVSLFGDAQVATAVKLRQMGVLVLTVVVAPGFALLAGALPFLRERARA
jgi:hypothetical protein